MLQCFRYPVLIMEISYLGAIELECARNEGKSEITIQKSELRIHYCSFTEIRGFFVLFLIFEKRISPLGLDGHHAFLRAAF